MQFSPKKEILIPFANSFMFVTTDNVLFMLPASPSFRIENKSACLSLPFILSSNTSFECE